MTIAPLTNRAATTRARSLAAVPLTVVLLAGCSSGAFRIAMPSAGTVSTQSQTRGDSGKELLYVADLGKSRVDVDSYPAGKRKQVLSGFGSTNGECADSSGDVFVSDGHNSEIVEYSHGGTKPIATLTDAGFYTLGCSVDLKTGDLAAAIQATNSDPGGIAIFKKAKGKAKNYIGNAVYFPGHCGYDDKNDLFFDGSDTNGNFAFAELPANGRTFTQVTLNQSILVAGGVQWDGQYIAVGDQGVGYRGSTIYQFAISGSTGTEMGSTTLGGSSDVIGFWIAGDRVIGPNIGSSPNVMYWRYPAGGNPLKTITGFTEPVAVTVSNAE